MFQTILVPLDGSKHAEAIFDHVESMADRYQAEIIFVHVREPPIMLGWDEVIDELSYRRSRNDEKKKMDAYLLVIKEKFQEKGINARAHIRSGLTVEAIIESSEEAGADLIAMVTHGLEVSTRSSYGSVAVGLLRHTNTPLLLLRHKTRSDIAGRDTDSSVNQQAC